MKSVFGFLNFSRLVPALVVALMTVLTLLPVSSESQEPVSPPVDVVFALDLSSSSNGLIDHLRNHLWDYWWFFTHCSPRPNFRIGVVGFSRPSYGKSNGYVKVIRDLGTDLETLSSILYKIPSRIEKGDQYVGAALNTCQKKISWSKDPDALKVIFLVGNGEVTRGPEDYQRAIEKLKAQNVVINTIYCTAPGERKAMRGWQRIAEWSGGKCESISIRNRYFDNLNGFNLQRFRGINRKFNQTYLPYGPLGHKRAKMLQDEDNHVYITNTEGYRFRSMYKISDDFQNRNHEWDLVDLYYRNPVAYMDVDRRTMNDSCRRLDNWELKSYIIYKKYERKKLSAMIADMIIEKEMKDKEEGKTVVKKMATLDIVSIRMLRDMMKQRGFTCHY